MDSSEWIPVAIRKPLTDGEVWGWNATSKIQDKYWFSRRYDEFSSMNSETPRNITHWMPLPAPPTEETK